MRPCAARSRAEIALALEHEDVLALVLGLLDLDVACVCFSVERALGTLDRDGVLGDRHLDALGDFEWFTTDARHDSPDLAEDLAADALVAGLACRSSRPATWR